MSTHLVPRTFARSWSQAVLHGCDRPFLAFEDDGGTASAWTYGQFGDVVDHVAGLLRGRGVEPGDRVQIALTNSPTFVALWLAVTKLGATLIPCDPQATAREFSDVAARTTPHLIVCDAENANRFEALRSRFDVICPDPADVRLESLGDGATAPPEALVRYEPRPWDTASVMFTSGTTSAPKGVQVTQANYAFAGDVMASAAAVTADDRLLVVLPLFHANAQYYSFAAAIARTASVALTSRFSASRFLDQAVRHKATHASLFAAPIRMTLARGSRRNRDVRLRHVWFAQNVSDEQYHEISGLLRCAPRQLYGMTETIPAVLTNPYVGNRPSSLGLPTLGCGVELIDDDGKVLTDVATRGEIAVAGTPGTSLFSGYLDDPETTARSYEGSLFRTGDFARRDTDGFLYFEGRSGDMLKVAGENVSTVEVEALIASHPKVLEAAVVGRRDAVRDEVPIAYVVVRPGVETGSAELMAWCAEHLAPSKRPHELRLVAELPRTSVGKIRKFLLTETSPHGPSTR